MPPGNDQAHESFQAIAHTMLAKHRGKKSPIVFVNHRPNIDALTMEILSIGELLVGVIAEDGEIKTIGSIRLHE